MMTFDDVFVGSAVVLMLVGAIFPPAFFLHGIIPIWRGNNELVLGLVALFVVLSWGLWFLINGSR